MEVAEVKQADQATCPNGQMMKKFANPSGTAKMMKSLGGLQKQFGGGGGMGLIRSAGTDKK